MDRDRVLRTHVLSLLGGHAAHEPVQKLLAGVPESLRGERPNGLAHSPWEVLEHLRIAQWDILEYARNPSHVSPKWPQGYWPSAPQPPDAHAWTRSLEAFAADARALEALIEDPSMDLLAPLPHSKDGHTLLREALLVADHNAYHGAEMVVVRRALGAW